MSTTIEPETHEHELPPEAAATPADPNAEQAACPACGAPTAPGQLMCLECGSRLALDYRRPPSWRLPAAIVAVIVLLAGAGVALVLAKASGDAGKTTAAAPTQPVAGAAPADTPPSAAQPAPAPTASTTAPAASGGAATTPPAATGTTPAPAPAPAAGWPAGKSGFTVVLASLPGKAAADDKLKAAQAAGISGASVLHSDDFPTLRPGYWVVFDGQYDTIGEATQQAGQDRGKGDFKDAYPRFVSKDANAKP
jgi:cell division septation protein DedD